MISDDFRSHALPARPRLRGAVGSKRYGSGVPGIAKTSAVVAATTAVMMAGCGSGDSTVAKTPQNTNPVETPAITATEPVQSSTAVSTVAPPTDPCAVNLTAPQITKAVAELPRDPRSGQPWNPEALAGNYNTCSDISAVIVKANTTTTNPSTRAVLFHRGEVIAKSVPDTYGFNGIDLTRSSGDTVALQNASGIPGLTGVVTFHWNGTGVEIVGNTAR